jgi:alkylation response protein AidB-like acyl-CoA dehydrogenase
MDFSLDPDHEALAELTARIVGDRSTPTTLASIEAGDERFDRPLWRDLSGAGLLCPALPEDLGGLGLGMVGSAMVLSAFGEGVPFVPLPWHLTGVLALGTWGAEADRERWLGPALTGELIVTCATPAASLGVTVAEGPRLTGTVVGVPYAHIAGLVVVPVGAELYVIKPADAEVSLQLGESTNRELHAELELTGVAAVRLESAPEGWFQRRLALALAAVQAGVTAAALRQTAAYTSERKQFAKPLSAFQGVALKAADGYVDSTGIRVAVLRAAWMLDSDEAAATAPVLVAAWWAAEAGQHCVHITQHLHGGTGADVTFPIHRYFLWGKQIELMLGGASALGADLGNVIIERDDVGDALTVSL